VTLAWQNENTSTDRKSGTDGYIRTESDEFGSKLHVLAAVRSGNVRLMAGRSVGLAIWAAMERPVQGGLRYAR